nr:MAG TPA: hypothetical protein [Caudoviricetes sp.]
MNMLVLLIISYAIILQSLYLALVWFINFVVI